MSVWEALVIALAGGAAGCINAVVGSGSLITFPTLLFFGIPPLTANMSNNLGLVPGAVAATWGYRREITSVPALTRRYVTTGLCGGIVGAALLLVLPAAVFAAVVPVLIAVGVALVIVGPWWQRSVREARRTPATETATPGRWAILGMAGASIYGGYFGAGQGVLQMGVLSASHALPVPVLTGVKNAVGAVVNLIAAVVFVTLSAHALDWLVVALVGVGSTIGGWVGARLGRRLPASILRLIIVGIGVAAIIYSVKNS